jgi:N-methylhydantoinase B
VVLGSTGSDTFTSARLEVLWSRLLAMADEMAVALTRTAYSPIVRDAHDYGCAIFDANGDMLAIATDATPGLSVSAMVSVRNMLEVYPAAGLRPGDVLITNDPWLATGHLLDLTIVTPVFHQGRLAGYTVAVAHHMDIGGRKTTPDSTEVYEEGLLLPVLKLYEEGRANETLFRILAGNVRVPEMVIGDVHAQVAANALGAQRMGELLTENGWADLGMLGREILARAEGAMRGAIARIPSGTYRGELPIDGFDEALRIVATVTVRGSELSIDFTGTSPQVNHGINCVLPITQGVTLIGLQLALDPKVPINSGILRPLQMTAPSGSVLAARHPAPVVARSMVLDHIPPVIFLALAEAIPGQVCAASGGPVWSERFYGRRTDGRSFFALQLLNGGMGARPERDGVSALSFPNNVASVPVESFEVAMPLLVERKGLIADTGGPGQRRGGLGQEFRVRVLPEVAGEVTLSIRADRTRHAAPGLREGKPGRVGRVVRNETEALHPKRPVMVRPGDVISWQLAGGGGYGDPYIRDTVQVVADVRAGWVTVEAAQREYGVVVTGMPPDVQVDEDATRALRAEMIDARSREA